MAGRRSGAGPTLSVSQTQARAFRWRAQQLDAAPGSAAGLAQVAILDLGVQETGHAGASWSLACRGVEAYEEADVACAWTLRAAPHVYRRMDLAGVAVATSPLDEADAKKKVFDAAKPLREAGLTVLQALAHQARMQRDIVHEPTVKGDLSHEMTQWLEDPYLRHCRPCGCIHPWENPFRLAALQAGLELELGTAPPVLRRIEGLTPLFFERSGTEAEARYDVVRGYLRFFGPASVKDAAAFLDSAPAAVKAHWPSDVAAVAVEGLAGERFVLAEDLPALEAAATASASANVSASAKCSAPGNAAPPASGSVKLLGPYDPWLQARDRELITADAARRKTLWPVLGRPGAVAIDGDVVALWRPKSSGARLTVRVEPWIAFSAEATAALEAEAERLAAHRGQRLAGVTTGS